MTAPKPDGSDCAEIVERRGSCPVDGSSCVVISRDAHSTILRCPFCGDVTEEIA